VSVNSALYGNFFISEAFLRLSMRKYVSLVLIAILALSSLMIVKSVSSEITKPFIPEFTLRYGDNSYDVPPTTTTTIDPYTGNKTVTSQAGYQVFNRSIEVIIKNQPFTPYTDANGNYVNLAYAVRWKGHYSESWNNLPNRTAYFGATNIDGYGIPPYSTYTTIFFGLDWKDTPIDVRGAKDFDYDYYLAGVPEGGQVDFQIQTAIGYSTLIPSPRNEFYYNDYYMIFTGQTSDWSSTQTITVGNTSKTTNPTTTLVPSQSPTGINPSQSQVTTPQQPDTQNGVLFGFDWEQIAIIFLGVIIVVLAFALVFSSRRSAKQTQAKTPIASVPQIAFRSIAPLSVIMYFARCFGELFCTYPFWTK
jgi:hypothetical protein